MHMTQKDNFLYKNIVLQSSFQTVGHVDEYFIQRTKHLIIWYCMPRMQGYTNDIYLYEKSKLKAIIHKPSSSHPVFYYLYWLWTYWFVIIVLCKKEEKWIVFAGHPLLFFGIFLQTYIRSLKFAYWIGDYFPEDKWYIRLYENLKKHYHNVIPITYYISDRINRQMNKGVIVNLAYRKTVAWGMKSLHMVKKNMQNKSFAFIGVIKPSQNIESVLKYIYNNPQWRLKILGICEVDYYRKLLTIITKYSIENRVLFPNKFIPEDQLKIELEDCLLGLALYKSDEHQFMWYADPGKIKTYLEFSLPVIMTDSSLMANDVKIFHCGEIVRKQSLDACVHKIAENYSRYQKGIHNLIYHYDYLKYYDNQFIALRQ